MMSQASKYHEQVQLATRRQEEEEKATATTTATMEHRASNYHRTNYSSNNHPCIKNEDTDTEYDTGQEDNEYEKKEEKSTIRTITSLIVSFVSLMTMVIVYCCIGGLLFHSLEGPSEVIRSFNINQLRNNTVLKLWNITDQFNVLYKENWTSLVSNEMVIFQREIVKAVKDGFDDNFVLPLSTSPQIASSSSVTSSILSVSSSSSLSPSSVPFSSTLSPASLASSLSSSKSSAGGGGTSASTATGNSKNVNLTPEENQSPGPHSQWSFAGSFLYSLSLITTTGKYLMAHGSWLIACGYINTPLHSLYLCQMN